MQVALGSEMTIWRRRL